MEGGGILYVGRWELFALVIVPDPGAMPAKCEELLRRIGLIGRDAFS